MTISFIRSTNYYFEMILLDINPAGNKKSTPLKPLILFFSIAIALLSTGCEEEDGTISCAPPFSNIDLEAESVNGEDIPYKSYDIDADNYQQIESLVLTVNDDGTWESEIQATNVVGGSRETVVTNKNGTYECSGAFEVTLKDTEGNEGVVVSYTRIPIITTTGISSHEYRIHLKDGDYTYLYIYEEPFN